MSLQRIAIRAALKAALVGEPGAAPTFAGTNVTTNRAKPVWDPSLAGQGAISIYTARESFEKSQESPRQYRRTTSIYVELFLQKRATELLDDHLDQVLAQIEVPILADPTLGGCAEDVQPVGLEVAEDATGRQLHGDVRLTFDVDWLYDVVEGDPATLYAWLRAHTDFNIPDADSAPSEKADDVNLQT